METKQYHRITLRKFWLALCALAILILLHTMTGQTSFRALKGEARMTIIPLDDPQWSLVDPVIMVRENDSQTLLITPGIPEQLAPSAPVFVLHLKDSKFERFKAEAVRFESVQVLWPYPSQPVSSEDEGNVLLASAGKRKAHLFFSGVHFKFPTYFSSGFPDPRMKGWRLVDSYSGRLRLEISGSEGKDTEIVLQQWFINQRTILQLSGSGFWLFDGKYFFFNGFLAGDRRLFFFSTENSNW